MQKSRAIDAKHFDWAVYAMSKSGEALYGNVPENPETATGKAVQAIINAAIGLASSGKPENKNQKAEHKDKKPKKEVEK